MQADFYKTGLSVGAGRRISASIARIFSRQGRKGGLLVRNVEKLNKLATETGAVLFSADAAGPKDIAEGFVRVDTCLGIPDVEIYSASARAHGSVADIDPTAVSAFGAFLTVQLAARRMLQFGHGAILLTGASAAIKGFPPSSAFAMGKFAPRGLAQSAARELSPEEIHVAHFLIDRAVRSDVRPDPNDGRPDSTLSPEGIAEAYWSVLQEPRNAWSHEVDLRPWVERFYGYGQRFSTTFFSCFSCCRPPELTVPKVFQSDVSSAGRGG